MVIIIITIYIALSEFTSMKLADSINEKMPDIHIP